MKVKHIGLFVAAVMGFGLVTSAHAATVTYGSATTISADTDVDTQGTLLRAYSFGRLGGGQTVNGVTFSQFYGSSANGDTTTITSNADNAYSGGGGSPFSSLSSNYQSLVSDGQYSDNGTPASGSITLNNLVVNDPYLVEFWVNDSRPVNRSETIDGVNLLYSSGSNSNGALGQFVIGTFTANATSQVFNFVGTDGDTQINALELRAVPEPASLVALVGLCGMGLIGLVIRRRRKA
jgi:hypothetical protein